MEESGVVSGGAIETPLEMPVKEPAVADGDISEISEELQGNAVEGSENETGDEVIEETAEPDVVYEELLNAINSMNSTPDYEIDYMQLLQNIYAEQQKTNQYLIESNEYQSQIADSMKLVNTCFYVLFIIIVGVIGYKIMSWLI